MVNFSTWIFSKFPDYFWENDSYKDGQGLGLLQRYLKAIGQELDENITPQIANVQDIQDPITTAEKYLTHLSDVLGNPPDTFYDVPKYRRMLRYIMGINKCKGTIASYEKIFAILGVTINITQIAEQVYQYDTGEQYDKALTYDTPCPPCTDYTLAIIDPDDNFPILGTMGVNLNIYRLLMAIIKYVEPINARLITLTYKGVDITTGSNWVLTTGIWYDDEHWKDTAYYKDNV